ncbi:TPA: hypothetical protein ACNKKM_001719 [Enterococcus faecalis]|nr:hypothetical protein [Enterococcus faecalis]EMC0703969.1 hypothetical protein [Enterococcus faecalis]
MKKIVYVVKRMKSQFDKNIKKSLNIMLIVHLLLLNTLFPLMYSTLVIIYLVINELTVGHSGFSFFSLVSILLYLLILLNYATSIVKKQSKLEIEIVTILTPILLLFNNYFLEIEFKLISFIMSFSNSNKYSDIYHIFSDMISKYESTNSYLYASLFLTVAPLSVTFIYNLFQDNRDEVKVLNVLKKQSLNTDKIDILISILELTKSERLYSIEQQIKFLEKYSNIMLTQYEVMLILELSLYDSYHEKKKIESIGFNHQTELNAYYFSDRFDVSLTNLNPNSTDIFEPRFQIAITKKE